LQLQILHLQAAGAAYQISTFIREIESQLGLIAQLPWPAGIIDQGTYASLRLRPAIRRLSLFASAGNLHARREDWAPNFKVVVAKKVYYGAVYFHDKTEPYMTLMVAGTRRDPLVSIAAVSLKSIWDVVSQIKVGERGKAYVADANGRVIAHPDIISRLAKHRYDAACPGAGGAFRGSYPGAEPLQETQDISGRSVLAAYAPVTPLGWRVFAELPVEEA
jgi:hypothetical protein